MLQLLIENSFVVDGSGQPGRVRPVAIKDGKIVLPAGSPAAAKVIDACGLVLAPGFIDIHSHSSLGGLRASSGESKLSQGVTTEITGNCGLLPETPDGQLAAGLKPAEFSRYLRHFLEPGLPLNLGFYVGHGTLRAAVMGYADRAPTVGEQNQMQELVAAAMEFGAVGLSSGLIYPPGMFAKAPELVALCRVVADYGGVYATHIRSEGDGLLAAVEEAIAIARETGVSLQVSHLKATGRSNWGKVKAALSLLEAAEAEGLMTGCDFYPYTASSTGLSSQLPNWALANGWPAAEQRLADPALRGQILAELIQNIENQVDWQDIVVSSLAPGANQGLTGKNLRQIGKLRRQHPGEALIDLLLEEHGSPGMIKFSMRAEDVAVVAKHRLALVGSDGVSLSLNDPANPHPHPRNFGAFPRVLRLYQREQKLFSLETAVHKMTGGPAAKLGLAGRGQIQSGFYADLVLFAPDTVSDASTYADPHQLCRGIESVWVNGTLAYHRGHIVDAEAGVCLTKKAKNRKSTDSR